MSRNDETVTVQFAKVVAKTDKAALLKIGDEEVWFPLSQCPDLEDVKKGDRDGEFECPEWLAEEKGVT